MSYHDRSTECCHMANIETLVGKTLTKIDVTKDQIDFYASDDSHYRMYHSQDCCESVSIDDVVGDWADLIGSPILKATAESNNDNPKSETSGESIHTGVTHTWTFYKLATVKGYVDIRWYGSSNGYYSEDVDFKDMNDSNDYRW